MLSFGSAETKLKQLQQKLRESEQNKIELNREVNELRKDLKKS